MFGLDLLHDRDFLVKLALQAAPLVALDLLGVINDHVGEILAGHATAQGLVAVVVIYLTAALSKKRTVTP